jgi:hypothetical protein
LECSVFFSEDGDDLIGSEPLIIHITVLTKLRNFVAWLILLPLLFLKENRSWKALWILLPYYAWLGIATGLSAVFSGMGDVLVPLPATLCILFLVGQRCQRWSGGLVLISFILIAVLTHLGGHFIGQFAHGFAAAVGSAVLFLLVLVATLLARLCCRRQYSALRFALFLLAFVMLLTLLAAVGIASTVYLQFSDEGIAGLALMLMGVVMSSLVTGTAVYMLLLSFLAVPFSTEFYGVRLRGLLKVSSGSPPPPPV